MTYVELCKSFVESGGCATMGFGKEIGYKHFVTIPSTSGWDSSNSLLISYLNASNIQYLQDFNGTIWIMLEGNWTRTVSTYDKKSDSFSYAKCQY